MYWVAYEQQANGDRPNRSNCVFMFSAKVWPEVQGQILLLVKTSRPCHSWSQCTPQPTPAKLLLLLTPRRLLLSTKLHVAKFRVISLVLSHFAAALGTADYSPWDLGHSTLLAFFIPCGLLPQSFRSPTFLSLNLEYPGPRAGCALLPDPSPAHLIQALGFRYILLG